MTGILDAQALLAFFGQDCGNEKVESALIRALEKDSHLLMTSVSFGEVYYVVLRRHG